MVSPTLPHSCSDETISCRRVRPAHRRGSQGAFRFAAALACIGALAPRAVHAQSPGPEARAEAAAEQELAAAREKFSQALALQTGGDWAGALLLLKEVAEFKATPHVLFNIGLCEENLGQLVAALGRYELAAADAREEGATHVEAEATSRLETLRARIPKLSIHRGDGASRATITVDEVQLGEAALDRPLPVDPGAHVVRAKAAGFVPFEAEVKAEERATVEVTVSLLPIERPGESKRDSAEATSSSRTTWMYVTGGVGVASLAASGIFFILRQDAINELDRECPRRIDCEPSLRSTKDRGETYTAVGWITLGVGLGGIATATLLWAGAGQEDDAAMHETRPHFALVPQASTTGGGATVFGTF